MDRGLTAIKSGLYPLWLIAANVIARLGGMLILILIGHTYSQGDLGTYFQVLATVGLAVTATQAGSGPLLVRLAQSRAFRSTALVVVLRLVIAMIASMLIITMTDMALALYCPLILIPLAAALSPDWVVAAKTRFSRLGAITVAGQAVGIVVALWAVLTHSLSVLYLIAPAISLASLAFSTAFALERTPTRPEASVEIGHGSRFGLVGFTLLAGFLPNLDFVLLGAGNDAVFMAQRILLFCAGLIAAIAATLFAKQQTGKLRDIWLVAPMATVSGLLFFFPDTVANLVYHAPSHDLVNILQLGSAWPLLLALLSRQILILQEVSQVKWVGWICLAVMAISAISIPTFETSTDIMALIVFRMACMAVILFACQKVLTKRRILA